MDTVALTDSKCDNWTGQATGGAISFRRGQIFADGISNKTAIALRWSRPYSDVPISQYFVLVNGSVLCTLGSVTVEEQELYPGSTSNFSVMAKTVWGESSWSEPPH